MLTTHKREAGSLLVVAALMLILIAAGFGRTSGPSARANDAYSQRMTQQAQQLQEEARAERARDAWTSRLTGLALLEGKAPGTAAGMSDRAIAAWADRLQGLAEYYAASK
jgi:type II secretory pathway pseudopilin PulG